MRWFPRLSGIAVLLGLVGWSFGYSVSQLNQITDSETTASDRRNEELISDEAGDLSDVPQYLAFTGGIPSGLYRVADLPDIADWDYGERNRTPAPASISEDNPVDYEVTVEAGPHVTPAEPGDGGDGDSDSDDGSDSDSEEGVVDDDSNVPWIQPGLYATAFGVEQCEYELRRIMDDNRDHVIGHDMTHRGRMLVHINEYEPDTFVATESCGEWTPWSPLVEPLASADDGDYWIGDLRQGTWDVPVGCLWEKVISYRGARLEDVESSGVGPTPLQVDRFTLGVRIRHCGDSAITLTNAPLPPIIAIPDLEEAQEAAHRRPPQLDRELTEREARRIERRRR